MTKILVTGSLGQVGSDLVIKLREDYGIDNVIATDLNENPDSKVCNEGIFEKLDVLDVDAYRALVEKYNVDTIFNLAGVLSAVGEAKPMVCWNVNVGGVINTLEIAKDHNCKVLNISSIAAFGPSTPLDNTPQVTIQRPTTMYGVAKVASELLCDYYHHKYGVDTRAVRFPGIISYAALPGGGTTDYAVEIYYEALKSGKYTSFIDKGTHMDMMYMPDAIGCLIQLMEADGDKLVNRNAYNVSAMSFDPEEIAASIKKYIPTFEMDYDVDPLRQGIAESWPNSLDISCAKEEWGFHTDYDLDAMSLDMLKNLSEKLNIPFEG
ncbi:L-threonine 3-dehydrogenase [Facklamia sp. DSM 111018]|uniref:L-threonine 3-dehydrogenase n=1 Tax=Facklamia lactis TaxID=2749967 RepID=A0ABS0LRL8_9LACT|nr:L-threonine 3-dehydrogenase [Facklamia lactis]MBG9980829.1 L-threonine 3-dehydrogenase [Facklamia lactis]MBG9986808.1 L-threonine 3-dehydrogenase [Facklamia lactis]